MNLIETLEAEMGKDVVPSVHVGDTVNVHYLIREGDKERIQIFSGTVLSISGRGIRKSITVRRIVQGEGVERIFPLHNPRVKEVEIVRRGYRIGERVLRFAQVKVAAAADSIIEQEPPPPADEEGAEDA